MIIMIVMIIMMMIIIIIIIMIIITIIIIITITIGIRIRVRIIRKVVQFVLHQDCDKFHVESEDPMGELVNATPKTKTLLLSALVSNWPGQVKQVERGEGCVTLFSLKQGG